MRTTWAISREINGIAVKHALVNYSNGLFKLVRITCASAVAATAAVSQQNSVA